MMALREKFFRYISIILCFIMVFPCFNIISLAESNQAEGAIISSEQKYERTGYNEYLSHYSNSLNPNEIVSLDLKKATALNATDCTYENRENSAFGLVLGEKTNSIEIPVEILNEGMYELEFTYFPLDTSSLDIEVSVMINGSLPFTESGYCKLFRTFVDTEILVDDDGHDISPDTENNCRWITGRLMDSSGINGNYKFYLAKGNNVLTINSNKAPFLLSAVSLKPSEQEAATYKEYIKENKLNKSNVKNYSRKVQAEKLTEKSSSAITSSAERTSILLEPFDYYKSRINILDGSRWINPGDWVSWEIEVEEDGFYNLGFKYRQNFLDGLYSSRDVLIDGKVLFEELKAVHFDYTTKWAIKVLGDDKPFEIYLTKGKHTLTLKNVLGDFSETLDVMKSCVNEMNSLYLDIVEITSSEPDTNRDYYLDDLMPNISERFIKISKKLFAEAERLSKLMDGKGAEIAVFEDIAYQLESYANNIDSLTNNSRITNFSSNITTLSSKIETLSEQGLDLDYIAVTSVEKEMPKCNPGFFEGIWGNIKLFFASFTDRYSVTNKKELRIWVSGGQEQLEIIRTLVREEFTAKTGIPVSVELVSGSLQRAALAGNNPDLALNIDSGVPVNFALRGALVDISKFEGFEKIESQYRKGSFTPYTLNGGIYGIPSTETFQMVFVRKDIFEQMNLEVPNTWDELLDLAPILQRKNMHVGMGASYGDLVFQHGGKYYNEELTDVCFTENANVEAFKLITSFFTDYGFPLTYDFLTRFRTGEFPIGIAPYSMYNSLSYSAPEIKGLWEMYPLLGKKSEDGSVNNTGVASPVAVSIMFKNSKNKENAWDFLKWWADSSIQTAYALKLESIMGVSARYNTANIKTIEELPWTDSELNILKNQISKLETLPILPGSYYVDRCYNNAYRAVVNHGENPREMLTKWTTPISEELARKKKEFDTNNKK